MSVQLGRLKDYVDGKGKAAYEVEVYASDYDANELWLSTGGSLVQVEFVLTRAHLEEFSKIIDRFLDR
jgi:hypothetical protein